LDGVMVIRGDLGIETDLAEIPLVQKRIIATANARARPVVTAAQIRAGRKGDTTRTLEQASKRARWRVAKQVLKRVLWRALKHMTPGGRRQPGNIRMCPAHRMMLCALPHASSRHGLALAPLSPLSEP
jgi:hypothetical protein